MRNVIFVLLLIFNSVSFSQNNLGMILNEIIYIPFSNDTCDCVTKTITQYNYSLFGKRKVQYSNKIKYIERNRLAPNGKKFVYDSTDNKDLIDWLSIASRTSERFDTILTFKYRAIDSANKPEWAKARDVDYDKFYTVSNGLITKIETKFKKFNYIAFLEYDSKNRNIKTYERDRFNMDKKILSSETVYDSIGNVIQIIDYEIIEGELDTFHEIKYFYNHLNQVVKREMLNYGYITQTLLFEYNENGLESEETYYNEKGKWDGSYETVYNEKGQEVAVYKLNRKGKRKRLLTTYEYE